MELKYEQDGNSGFSIDSENRKDIASVWIEEENYLEAEKLALLFIKSPKMLEQLKEVLEFLQKVQSPATQALFLSQSIKNLIKEATTI